MKYRIVIVKKDKKKPPPKAEVSFILSTYEKAYSAFVKVIDISVVLFSASAPAVVFE